MCHIHGFSYQEILTDPSYAGQFVLMTNPHIGNTGINPGLLLFLKSCKIRCSIIKQEVKYIAFADDEESSQCFLGGLIIRNLSIW